MPDLNLLGTTSVAAALLGAVFVVATGLWAGLRRRPELEDASRYGVYVVFAAMTAAVAVMEVALLTHDFSVEYVAQVGSRETPTYYTAISLWSSLEGSILFWGWILAAYAALVARVNRASYPRFMPYVHATMMVVGIFFFGLLLGPADPFGQVFPVPENGPGPNPLLQNHPLMGLHPPLLYLGYVGMTIPFAFAMAGLATGNLGERWIRASRRWMLAPWAFLSLGIVAGGWWSYEVLGWGGWWAWDPVENASFLPWLTATAFLHSVMVQERRGMLKTWNLTLVIGTFCLTLFGTFLTRSGVLDSVHAFTEGVIGPVFLAFIAVIVLASIGLVAWRSDRLHAPGTLDGTVSRESAFVVNNLLFVALTFTVLLGTVFPLVVEALQGERVSVGAPYFDMVSAPIGMLLLFLMGVGPALPWGRASTETLRERFAVPAAVGLAVIGASLALGVRQVYPILTFGLAGFVVTTIVDEFRKGMEARRRISGARGPRALWELLMKNRRRYGGYVVHFGIVVIIVAMSVSRTWRFEREVTVNRGETARVGEYQVRLEEVWGEDQPQRFVVGSTFTVLRDGDAVGTLEPRLNFYPNSDQPIATPAVRSSPEEDLYLTLLAFDSEEGRHATLRAIVNPGVPWLWIGGLIVGLGAVLAIWPRPGRRSRDVTLPHRAPGGPGGGRGGLRGGGGGAGHRAPPGPPEPRRHAPPRGAGGRGRRGGGRVNGPSRGVVVAGTVALAVGFLALLAFGLTRDVQELPSALVGEPAPAFRGETLEGDSLSSEELEGRVVVLNFWASWCVPCRQEHEVLLRTARTYPDSTARVVGIVYQDGRSAARRFMEEMGGGWPSLMDPGSRIAMDFGVYGVPETYFLAPDGTVARKWIGPVTWDLVRSTVDSLRGGP